MTATTTPSRRTTADRWIIGTLLTVAVAACLAFAWWAWSSNSNRTPSASANAATPATAAASPTSEQALEVTCSVDGSEVSYPVTMNAGGTFDFPDAWSQHASDCSILGAGDNELGNLIGICAAADPDDVYLDAGYAMSGDQITETAAALEECPRHPYAKQWRAAMDRGRRDAKLEADGRLFNDGTYRVGKEIKPGTYVVLDVQDCYWERQDANGEIIDNNFVAAAKRVQVTVRKSDYGFHAVGCGQWRPVR